MTEYVLSNYRKYIKDATLQETVLDKYPAPNNVAEVYPKKLDIFIQDSLSEQKNIRGVKEDRNLEKIQKRVVKYIFMVSHRYYDFLKWSSIIQTINKFLLHIR